MTDLPETLSLDEAYRAAFFFVLGYARLDSEPSDYMAMFMRYMWTDPTRWSDWQAAVQRALADGGIADPDHEGFWQLRPGMPS